MLRTALFLLGLGLTAAPVMGQVGQETTPDYHIHAIRYATLPDFPLAGLMPGAPRGERLDIPMIFWVIQGGGRTILLDTGFHRPPWAEDYGVTDFMAADEAVGLLGIEPGDVTDIIVSHAHWDHMGGIDLFPDATIWIQEEEFRYYTGPAWQEGGRHGGIDPADVLELVRRNTEGKVRLIPGDNVEILPGIRPPHLRIAVREGGRRPAHPAGLRQRLPLPQPRGRTPHRHLRGRRLVGEQGGAGAHDRAGGQHRSRRTRPRPRGVPALPYRRTGGDDPVAGSGRGACQGRPRASSITLASIQ
jgi:hypothetical protein